MDDFSETKVLREFCKVLMATLKGRLPEIAEEIQFHMMAATAMAREGGNETAARGFEEFMEYIKDAAPVSRGH